MRFQHDDNPSSSTHGQRRKESTLWKNKIISDGDCKIVLSNITIHVIEFWNWSSFSHFLPFFTVLFHPLSTLLNKFAEITSRCCWEKPIDNTNNYALGITTLIPRSSVPIKSRSRKFSGSIRTSPRCCLLYRWSHAPETAQPPCRVVSVRSTVTNSL